MAWSPEDSAKVSTLWDNLAFFIGRASFLRKYRVGEGRSWWFLEDTFSGSGPLWGSRVETFTFFGRSLPGWWRGQAFGSPPDWYSQSPVQMWGEPFRVGGAATMTNGSPNAYWGLDFHILKFFASFGGGYPNFDAYYEDLTYGMAALGWQFSKSTLKVTRGGFWPSIGLEGVTTRFTVNSPGGNVWYSPGGLAGYTETDTYQWQMFIRYDGTSELSTYVTMYDTADNAAPLRVHHFTWNVPPGPLTIDCGVTADAELTDNNPYYAYKSTDNVSIWMRINGPASTNYWDGPVPYINTSWTNGGLTVSNPLIFNETFGGSTTRIFERDTQLLYYREEYNSSYTIDFNAGGWRWGTL